MCLACVEGRKISNSASLCLQFSYCRMMYQASYLDSRSLCGVLPSEIDATLSSDLILLKASEALLLLRDDRKELLLNPSEWPVC